MSEHKQIPVTDADLAGFDEEYEGYEATDSEFEPVPDGKYQVKVETVELTRTQKGDPMLKWMLRIVGPTHQGRVLWRNNVMATPENIRWLKKDLFACEVKLARISELPANLGLLLDLHLEVTKKTRGEFDSVFINKRIHTLAGAEGAQATESLGTF
jgi:hypothetical protein